MSDVPTPTGYDVYWEKWIDAFEEELENIEIEELEDNIDGETTYEEESLIMGPGMLHEPISHIRSIITPFGVLPITEKTRASRYFKLWVGHSNFKLTENFYDIIGQSQGVEALDILTPYRFRIAIGKMFVDRKIMKAVRDQMVSYVSQDIEGQDPIGEDDEQKNESQ